MNFNRHKNKQIPVVKANKATSDDQKPAPKKAGIKSPPPHNYEINIQPVLAESSFSNIPEGIKADKTLKQKNYTGLDLKKFTREDFEFGAKLGKGKFGDVYIAREKKTNFIVAIKVLNKACIRQLKAQKQVIREIKIHSFLHHPNIIKLYGVFHDDENVYMIMEYAPNGELYKELKSSVTFIVNVA